MRIEHHGRSFRFRSEGIGRFLGLLIEAYPEWLDVSSLQARLPGVGPRQLARYVDGLENARFRLVGYETKTRGRYRLIVPPEEVRIAGSSLAGASPARPGAEGAAVPATPPLEVHLEPGWIAWLTALLLAGQAANDLPAAHDGALGLLEDAAQATARLPAWTLAAVQLEKAEVMARMGRRHEANGLLRRVDTAVRAGVAHPAVPVRLHLMRARMRYDQGRYAEAERLVAASAEAASVECAHGLNLRALLAERRFRAADGDEARHWLSHALHLLTLALGQVFLRQADNALLDALTCNYGNNLLHGVRSGMLPTSCADTGMRWLAANRLACHKLGVGGDSVAATLSLVDAGLDHGLEIAAWPAALRQGISSSDPLAGLLLASLGQARKTGSRLEIALCQRRWARLAGSEGDARRAYLEGGDIFTALGRRDELAAMRNEWLARFGTRPPARTGRVCP